MFRLARYDKPVADLRRFVIWSASHWTIPKGIIPLTQVSRIPTKEGVCKAHGPSRGPPAMACFGTEAHSGIPRLV